MFPVVLHQCTLQLFLRDNNGNKVTQLLCVIPAIIPNGKATFFTTMSILMNLYLYTL